MDEQKRMTLRNIISEHMRAEKSSKHKIDYVDLQNNFSESLAKTNTVVYGRRGSGKTTLLLKTVQECMNNDIIPIYMECEQCKDYSYPNTLVFLIKNIFEDLKYNGRFSFFKKNSEINDILDELTEMMREPDLKRVERKIEKSNYESSSGSAKIPSVGPLPELGIDGKIGHKHIETETSGEDMNKIDVLKHNLKKYKIVLEKILKTTKKEYAFILLDDFYFVRRSDQPKVVDYIHRMAKGSPIFFKIATVRHRSELYQRTEESITGVQEGHEYQVIDLDCTLEDIRKTEDFLKGVMKNILKATGIKIQDIFIDGDNGFPRLVWASGGVPRDMLNIVRYCLDELDEPEARIGKKEVDRAAKKLFVDKQREMSSEYGIRKEIPELFNTIFGFCININGSTAFLVKGQANGSKSAFNDLIDLRFIHLAKKGVTRKKSPGEGFDGYILDIGSYSDRLVFRKKEIEEINLYKEYTRKGDSEFRASVPIFDWGQMHAIKKELESLTVKPKKIQKIMKKSAKQPLAPKESLRYFFNPK